MKTEYVILLVSIIIVIFTFVSIFLFKLDKHSFDRIQGVTMVLANTVLALGIISFIFQIRKEIKNYRQSEKQAMINIADKGVLEVEKLFLQYNDELKFLSYEIHGNVGFLKPKGVRTDTIKQMEFHTIAYMIQIMEDVFIMLDLDKKVDDYEKIRGWIETFKTWGSSKIFLSTWYKIKKNYSRTGFVPFIEKTIINNKKYNK